MAGVDIQRAVQTPPTEISRLLRAVTESGEFSFNRFSGGFSPVPPEGKVHMNITRIAQVDGADPDDLNRAYLEGRRQVEEYARFAAKYLPGFERAYIDQIAPQLGIRETRRVVGEYQLTPDDVLGARSFPDAICRGAWPLEIHPNDGTDTTRIHLEGDTYYQIPYRCLVPRDLEQILVTGRCISTTHQAQGSTRVMGPGIATGQAAGTAAALALRDGRAPRAVDVAGLRASWSVKERCCSAARLDAPDGDRWNSGAFGSVERDRDFGYGATIWVGVRETRAATEEDQWQSNPS